VISTAALRILVVEDEAAFSSAIRRYFEHKGCAVAVTRDAIGALRSHRAQPSDVALIDLALPGADGLSLLRELREDPHPPECIVVTGRGSIETAVEATRSGAADFLTKPCEFSDLDVRIARAIERRGDAPAGGSALTLEAVERRHIAAILAREGWHQGHAADLLGISAKTLYRKIREYGLKRPTPVTGP
jgi:DNA-binding NtrC family response regulator